MKKTKEQLAKEYSNSVIDKIRKDRKEDPSHNIGYGDISEIAYKIGFDAGAKQTQEKIIDFIGDVAQGIYEEVNMGDSTITEIIPRLMLIEYIIRKIQNLMPDKIRSE